MAGLEQMKKKLLPLLNMDSNLAPGMSIDASASYKVPLLIALTFRLPRTFLSL